ncbi:MAG: metallophosphoesterase [Clostridia bacterium]|nr:metallophosphoesterase [Clostridia bacterium]
MKKEFLPVLRFIASSDAHIEGVGSVGYVRLKKAIDFSLSFAKKSEGYQKLDAVLMAGDFTDHGRPDEFDAFGEIFDYAKEKGLPVLSIVARGHECFTLKKKSLAYFRGVTGQETDFHEVIGGYHFIGLSTCRFPVLYYSPKQKIWLRNQLREAVADTPDKPVFLFHHEHVRDTVYGSSKFDGWGNPFFTQMLKDFPNVVDFSGHSHYPLNDPRSLWQKEYTAVGTGSLKYAELTVDKERCVHPPTHRDCATFWIAEADKDGNLHLMGIDCEAEKILCEYFLGNPADKSNREYTEEKQRSRSRPPLFPEKAEINLKEEKGNYTAEYPAAESTDGMPVFIYRAYVSDRDCKEIAKGKTVPSYYLYESEDIISTSLGALPEGKYTIRILAETAYGVHSESINKTIEI